jgi:integrase/recombinase XerD
MYRVSAKTTVWDDAMLAARNVEEQLRKSSIDVTESMTSVGKAVRAYLSDKRAQQLSDDTIKKLELIFEKQLFEWCARNNIFTLDELTVTKLREWRTTWKDKALSAKKKQERLVGFFHFCVSSGWTKHNPASQLSNIKVQQKPTDYFTRAEMGSLVSGTHAIRNGDRLRALLLLMRWSGLAIRDAVTLERSRLSADDSIFLYRAKTGTPVQVTIPPDVARVLRELVNSNPRYFFWTGNGNPKSAVADWQRSFRRLFKKANLCHEDKTPKRAFPHMLRDTFAVELLLAGVPIYDVSLLLGHSSVKTTEKHYAPFVMARQEQLTDYVKQAWV